MKTYQVQVPIAGCLDVEVSAGTRREAIDAALALAQKTLGEPGWLEKVEFIDAYERFVEGNVSQVELDEVVVCDADGYEIEEDDEADELEDEADEGDGEEDDS